MLDAALERKCLKAQERSATVTAPHIPENIPQNIPENIPSKPWLPKADVVANHTLRFSDN